jgi:hypothetical protein
MEKIEVARRLKSIFLNDKTLYDYHGKKSLNRFGYKPEVGRRWNTPAEIAQSLLKEMGYSHPDDVPDEPEICICDPKRRKDQIRINPYCKAEHAG